MQDRSQTRFLAAALQAERTRAEAHHLPSPTGLECVVGVVEDGARIESHCKRPDEDSA